MRFNPQSLMALLLAGILAFPAPLVSYGATEGQMPTLPDDAKPLHSELRKSYQELFAQSPEFQFSDAQMNEMRQYLEQSQNYCVDQFKNRAKQYDTQLRQAQDELKQRSAGLNDSIRHGMHCRIQNLRILKAQDETLAKHAIPLAYDNEKAKLELIQNWPRDLQQIRAELADGSYRNRQWGDVKDIGFRKIEPRQADDIKTGEDAVKQMKTSGLMPKTIDDEAIVDYVTAVAQKVARHSDLEVPLHVTALNSKEINAFALPGGFLFVERGLLEAADDESELAGVLGHEMAHVVARHGHHLMRRATIEGILFQAAEMSAVLLTGGAAGIGTYYALEYGFQGLGMILDLSLLGVSREYELQADQLGIQYAWNAGYDPSGFIRFFDKMATTVGYVNGVSWFRDHPPFYQRMVDAEREIMYLPKKQGLRVQTDEFLKMKKALVKVTAKAEENEKGRPSMLAPEQGCTPPNKIEYKPGGPIETICTETQQLGQSGY